MQSGKTFSTPLRVVGFEATSVVSSSAIAWNLGKGANSDLDTVVSWPAPRRITEYVWLPSTSSTGSQKGSPLFRTWQRRKAGPGCNKDEGSAEQVMTLPGDCRKLWWGVSFVERQSRDRTAWRASGWTAKNSCEKRYSNYFACSHWWWLQKVKYKFVFD